MIVFIAIACQQPTTTIAIHALSVLESILLLIASITTGRTAKHALQCIKYYGGVAQGIAAVFSTVDEINGLKVAHLFSTSDIPNYETYSAKDCPHHPASRIPPPNPDPYNPFLCLPRHL